MIPTEQTPCLSLLTYVHVCSAPVSSHAALTEVLLPKQVVICTPPAGQQGLQQLQPVKFVAAFCSTAARAEAEQLWQQLGRAGPPLFLKVRVRDALQELEQVRGPGG
jgi:hypothetical protein